MQGARDAAPREETAVLSHPAKAAAGRDSYLPAALSTDAGGRLLAEPLKWGGSSDFVAFARAEALAVAPAGAGTLEAGSPVKVVRLPG
jgi:molybdopterin biosynthesis enzyme